MGMGYAGGVEGPTQWIESFDRTCKEWRMGQLNRMTSVDLTVASDRAGRAACESEVDRAVRVVISESGAKVDVSLIAQVGPFTSSSVWW